MFDLLKKYWFFAGIFLVALVAFNVPVVGSFIREYHVLKVGIFLAFLITGLTLETSSIFQELRNFKVLAAALVSSLLLFPGIALVLAKTFLSSPDFVVGALIIGVAPVTIASGTVMTALARGNVPLSLFICVLCNFVGILTVPFLLQLFLQFGHAIDLPAARMLKSLSLTVFLPTVIGQVLRPWLRAVIGPYAKAFSVFSQVIVLLIILNAVSSSTERLTQAGADLLFVFLFMAGLHGIILALNYGLSRLMSLDRASTSAFTIHTSQKTLTVAYLVWAGCFATEFPMGLIPAITYHLSQMIMDTFLAQRWGNAERMRVAGGGMEKA